MTDAAMWPGQRIVDDDLAACCRAGLWLLHDFLDESHQISQRIDTATGSFWHGIMHRREGDYSNAKYWFRRVGPRHAVFEALAAELQHTGGQRRDTLIEQAIGSHDRWDAARFVDLCQAAAGRGTDDEMLCRRVQQREWRLLFDDCYRGAVENG
ncbi:MAG TPA: hypothetical protein VHZ24_16820 [Pirellulales bacterium]|nr:hypothetical protein [Pirellulales bacterium]